MKNNPSRKISSILEKLGKLPTNLTRKTMNIMNTYNQEIAKLVGLNTFMTSQMIKGGLMPTLQALMEMNTEAASSLIHALQGDKSFPEHLQQMSDKIQSGINYHTLTTELGARLFGSARFQGEVLLRETDLFTLSYLPPTGPPREETLFHAGGFLPFSDRIFRFLPEANLFVSFLERGIGVYAMELKGIRQDQRDMETVTLERIIEQMDELSDAAFEHNQRRQMIMEGYCGLGMPMLSYLAARPRAADAKFRVAFTMVSPVDGRRCELVNESIATTPRHLMEANFILADLAGGYIAGNSLQLGLDIPLSSLFHKTWFGRFAAGWKSNRYSGVTRLEELDPKMRKELAGNYWISPENCQRFPLPVDLARFSSRLWLEGVNDDLKIPYRFHGRSLNLRTIVDETRISLAGFYGGKDLVVPEATARVMQKNLGRRYTHVVHPDAGHISYVISPKIWSAGHPRSLAPNPIDLVIDLYAGGAPTAGGE